MFARRIAVRRRSGRRDGRVPGKPDAVRRIEFLTVTPNSRRLVVGSLWTALDETHRVEDPQEDRRRSPAHWTSR